jgi:hypothetical protein
MPETRKRLLLTGMTSALIITHEGVLCQPVFYKNWDLIFFRQAANQNQIQAFRLSTKHQAPTQK